MISNRGFTLIEVIVWLIITSIVIGAIYMTYINLFKGFKIISKTTESHIETDLALEIIRIDIEHAGFGIAINEPKKPLELVDSSLIIRTLKNVTRVHEASWVVVKCGVFNSTFDCVSDINPENINLNSTLTYINAETERFVIAGTINNLIDHLLTDNISGVFIGIYTPDTDGDCEQQDCFKITYTLSTSTLDTCNSGTRSLIRKVGDSNGVSILHCVSDFKVTFDVDFDFDGIVDKHDYEDNPTDVAQIRKVNIYILFQEGAIDRTYEFDNYAVCSYDSSRKCIKVGNVELKLPPSNYKNYRWKVIKLSVKPVNIIRGF